MIRPPHGQTYHQGMGASAVRRWVSTSRPADWLMVGSLLLLAWFEIWVEPIAQEMLRRGI